jgi:hypothetical protein
MPRDAFGNSLPHRTHQHQSIDHVTVVVYFPLTYLTGLFAVAAAAVAVGYEVDRRFYDSAAPW